MWMEYKADHFVPFFIREVFENVLISGLIQIAQVFHSIRKVRKFYKETCHF